MSENTSNKNVGNDEIDLLDLFRRMGNTLNKWFNALGKAILISIVFIFRRWLPLGLSIALGIGVSYIMKYTSDESYTSDLIIRANSTTSTSDMISYINKLHVYCNEDNREALAKALHISPENLGNINDIAAFWIIDNSNDKIPDFVDYKASHNVYDTINVRMQDRLNIQVQTKAPQELATIRNSLIGYINSDSLFQQRNRLRLRQNKEILARLEYDILQLDSLQKVKYFEETRNIQPKNGGQMIFLQEQKTQLVYTDIYDLYARKQRIETDLDLYQDIVTVLSDFSLPSQRDNGGLYYAKTFVPFFFIITLLLLVLIASQEKLKQVYNKY